MTNIYYRIIPEHRVEGKPLGRHIHHDPKSLNYAADRETKLRSVIHNARGLPLTQARSSCTAEALCGGLNSDPDFKIPDGRVLTQDDAEKLYDEEIKLEGGNPETDDPGGTGLLVCKAGQRMGLVGQYTHAFGLEHMLGTLVIRPVMVGTNWYESMDKTDEQGVIKEIAGGRRGGHEYVADEIDVEDKRVGFWQSWGLAFGLLGKFYLPWDLVDQLLHEDGDVTVPYPVAA